MTCPTTDLVSGVLRRHPASLGRAISLLERGDARGRDLRAAVRRGVPAARVIGVTGPPGAGKSTLVGALASALAAAGRNVAVIAVDPASQESGGAMLGDRVRMREMLASTDVYMRSLSSRGRLGGLATCVPAVLDVLEGAGFDDIVLETVGVGQSEAEVAALADSTVVLVPPRAGDDNQAAKSGLLEVADILAVTKGDDPDARLMVRHLKAAHRRSSAPTATWRVPVVVTSALQNDVSALLDALDAHRGHLASVGDVTTRRSARAAHELRAQLEDVFRARIQAAAGPLNACAAAETESERRAAAVMLLNALVRDMETSLCSCIQDTVCSTLAV